MLNSEVPYNVSADVLGQVSSYFATVENAVATGDTNKRYSITPQSCYAPGPPVQARSFTTFLISPSSDNTADIYNGYITAEMKVTMKVLNDITKSTPDDTAAMTPSTFWFGFKKARDAIEKYEICANGISIYTQSFAIEEGFITSCALPESVVRASPYESSKHKDVWSGRSAGSCGVVFECGGLKTNNTFDVTIPLCISLRSILPLSNIRYLPAFAGKIELRVYFSTTGMVYCPVGYDGFIRNKRNILNTQLVDITNTFTQLGDQIAYATYASNAFTVAHATCTTDNYLITKAYSSVPCFGIDNNIYLSLMHRYIQSALTFPTQTIAVFPCSNKLDNINGKTTQTVTPRFVETIFLLFPFKTSHKTVYRNPKFNTLQLQCGGYGNLPSLPVSTYQDPLHITLCKNAINLNSSVISINKEVQRSLLSKGTNYKVGIKSSDNTSFFTGLPTEVDNCFQQGMTSNTPITFELHVTQDSDNEYLKCEATPLMCFLVDSTFSIQVQENGAPPLVELGSYDITSPV